MIKKKTKTIEVYTVLFQSKTLTAWFGSDGIRIPVWELTEKDEAEQFLKDNKFHKPKLVKAKITYEV